MLGSCVTHIFLIKAAELAVLIDSPATDEERVCPILNLIRNPQPVSGTVVRTRAGAPLV
ncbi:hypothetical protein ACIBQ1_27720 [Nonomuraea sp. NPDC050153]|uniref:hypothetical protein n=1 Tax=Nonomuraea sp. NPDC050153 TaxID=3364359 RepID=UPI003797DD97